MENNAKVKLYSLSTCIHCTVTKQFLDKCKVRYEFIDLDLLQQEEQKAILEDICKINSRCSFPTIVINESVIVGFHENEIKEALKIQ